MERSEKRILMVVSCVLLALIIIAAVLTVVHNSGTKSEFETPAFDSNAVMGVPEISDGSSYGEMQLPISDGKCTVSMDGEPSLEDGKLNLYLTSDAENTVYIKAVVYSEDGTILGESGLLRAGEYVKSVTVADSVSSGSTLRVKILTYMQDTYYSMGSVNASLQVK